MDLFDLVQIKSRCMHLQSYIPWQQLPTVIDLRIANSQSVHVHDQICSVDS